MSSFRRILWMMVLMAATPGLSDPGDPKDHDSIDKQPVPETSPILDALKQADTVTMPTTSQATGGRDPILGAKEGEAPKVAPDDDKKEKQVFIDADAQLGGLTGSDAMLMKGLDELAKTLDEYTQKGLSRQVSDTSLAKQDEKINDAAIRLAQVQSALPSYRNAMTKYTPKEVEERYGKLYRQAEEAQKALEEVTAQHNAALAKDQKAATRIATDQMKRIDSWPLMSKEKQQEELERFNYYRYANMKFLQDYDKGKLSGARNFKLSDEERQALTAIPDRKSSEIVAGAIERYQSGLPREGTYTRGPSMSADTRGDWEKQQAEIGTAKELEAQKMMKDKPGMPDTMAYQIVDRPVEEFYRRNFKALSSWGSVRTMQRPHEIRDGSVPAIVRPAQGPPPRR